MLRRASCRRRLSSSLQTLAQITSRPSIVIAGAPGVGKTSVARILARRLSRTLIDVDDDVLERVWGRSVADQLARLGDQAFLRAEASATRQMIIPPNSVVSLTGSNPLDRQSMDHVARSGIVFMLDSPMSSIVARMRDMKLDRIVGQRSSSLTDVLSSRSAAYDACYDRRILVADGESPDQIADRILDALRMEETFISTRGAITSKPTFTDVVQLGLASDRGLFIPLAPVKPWTLAQLERLVHLDYRQRVHRVMERFPLGYLHPAELRQLIDAAYESFDDPSNPMPLQTISDFLPNTFLQETYHGPTASFKDHALQLTPRVMQWASEHHPTIGTAGDKALLVATSGDTGVAALDGFARVSIPVVVLYPAHGVSRIQRHQMLTAKYATPSRVIGIDNDFDYCQSATKDMFEGADFPAHGFQLTAGNSMNWGRLLPQIAFSVSAYLDLVNNGTIAVGDSIDMVVPTGNFGNILGVYMAKRMLGIPIERIICASNSNDVLVEFISTGVYDLRGRKLQQTQSPSVDILLSSNVERFLYHLSGGDPEFVISCYRELAVSGIFRLPPVMLDRMHEDFSALACSEADCTKAIFDVHNATGVLIDPHTSLGVHVATVMGNGNGATPIVVSSTAHFGKFPSAIMSALSLPSCDVKPIGHVLAALESIETCTPMHEALRRVMTVSEPDHITVLPPDSQLIRQQVSQFLRQQRQDRDKRVQA